MRNSRGQFVKGYTPETSPKTSVETKCFLCTTIFLVQPHRFKSGRGKYCSVACRRLGIFTKDVRIKMSLSKKGKPTGRTGELCHFWRGGITEQNKKIRMSMESRAWRETVFKRDNYQCVLGGKEHGNKLNADHIKPFALFPELRFELSNGRTLCIDCHKKTDTYGKKIQEYATKLKNINNT